MSIQEAVEFFTENTNEISSALEQMANFDLRDIEARDSRVESLEDEIAELEERIENFKPSATETDETLKKLRKKLKGLNTKINKTLYRSEDFYKLEEKISDCESEIEDRIEELTDDADDEKTELENELEGLREELSDYVENLESEIYEFKNKLERFQSECSDFFDAQYEIYTACGEM